MYIRIFRTRYPHWGMHSGINQFTKYLDSNSYDIEMRVVSDSDDDFPIHNTAIRNWLCRLVQKHGMQWYKLSDLATEMKVFRDFLFEKVDVIHYLDGEHTAQYSPWLCKLPRKIRPKIVATYHQPPELLNSLIIKDVIRRLDYITVVSPDQESYFKEFVAPHKIQVVLHGIDTHYFQPGNALKDKEKFKCITVGHWLRDFKAVRETAEKLVAYKNIEFHIVSSQVAEVEHLENVITYSGIDDDRLLKLYQQSDILFLPLIQSTANNAILEGIACGLPVVSTNLPSVKAYLPGKEAVLIKDNDPQQFADAIVHLFHNPDDHDEMAHAARKRAEELDWRNITPQYEGIYSKLISPITNVLPGTASFSKEQFRVSNRSPLNDSLGNEQEWSIGICMGKSPFDFVSSEVIKNPVITGKDVTDRSASFVADPFMLRVDNIWYMFFEVMNKKTNKGEIGLALSNNGWNWTYQQIVLAEPFHLSYPYVFTWMNDYYMIPESYQAGSVRLYKASKFPVEWSFIGTLLSGGVFLDSSIFYVNNHWWMFTETNPNHKYDTLRLYYADNLMGPWLEHPKSPIITENAHIARPAGRVVVIDSEVVRYTQDCYPMYGTQVRAFKITHLTTAGYHEQEACENLVLKPSGSRWNKSGMHHIDAHRTDDGQWIACVDGFGNIS